MQFELEDLVEQANEIQETLGRSYAVPDEIDEADLEAGTSFPRLLPSTHSNQLIPTSLYYIELDALALEEEDEGTSYLADISKAPDFIDEPPVELGEQTPAAPEAIRTTG